MFEKKIPRVFWVFPGDDQLPPIVITAPPEVWQDKVTGSRVLPEYWPKFIKVIEVMPPPLEIEHD